MSRTRGIDRLERDFAAFTAEVVERGVAKRLRGATATEINRLEAKLGLRLPRAYRLYLERLGHEAGLLFAHDHLAVTYAHVLEMFAADARELRLPQRAVLICGRLGEQFLYVLGSDRARAEVEDSPVYHIDIDAQQRREVYPDVLSWLRDVLALAVQALEDGYFDRHPGGTKP